MDFKTILRRFRWQREDEPQNLMTYLLLSVNVTYGVAFAFFSYTAPVMNSVLNVAFFPAWAWGTVCLLLVLATLLAIATRNRRLGTSIAFPAVAAWGYGFALSLLEIQLLAAFAVFLPQIIFWTFWHIGVIRYYEKEDRLEARRLLSKS